ncbi:unnamed protein product [Paramecium octaurelia]|uniref:Uncharacterized protein n=1 Tax=Paramecium octaurelia TaxID=43137 RepID=A0A8S1VRD5_PAROT|nr:unnamed protein product [Paramecium octaurelia]
MQIEIVRLRQFNRPKSNFNLTLIKQGQQVLELTMQNFSFNELLNYTQNNCKQKIYRQYLNGQFQEILNALANTHDNQNVITILESEFSQFDKIDIRQSQEKIKRKQNHLSQFGNELCYQLIKITIIEEEICLVLQIIEQQWLDNWRIYTLQMENRILWQL